MLRSHMPDTCGNIISPDSASGSPASDQATATQTEPQNTAQAGLQHGRRRLRGGFRRDYQDFFTPSAGTVIQITMGCSLAGPAYLFLRRPARSQYPLVKLTQSSKSLWGKITYSLACMSGEWAAIVISVM
jgi:hypothetical protein